MTAPLAPQIAARSDAGFSLMETLIGLTLTALIAALMFGSIQTGARIWQRDGEAQALSTRYVFTHRIGDWISRAMPAGVDMPSSPDDAPFAGGPAAVSFVIAGDGLGASPGLYRIDLGLAADERCREGAALNLRAVLLSPGDSIEPLENAPATARELVDCLSGASFQYYGAADDDAGPAWRSSWVDQTRLPLIVRLAARDASGKPEVILSERLSLAIRPRAPGPEAPTDGEPAPPEQ